MRASWAILAATLAGTTLLFLLLPPPLAAQHGRYLNDSRHPSIGKPEAIAAGAKLFAGSCGGCHGPDGSGGRGPNLVRRSLWHPLSDDAIFQVIRKGVPGTDMPPTNLSDDQTWQMVAFIHSLTGPAKDQQNIPGDAAAGKQVFAQAGCAGCHAIRGQGGLTAPDLSNVGGSRPLAVIREAILEPSKDLFYLGNEGVTVTMKDGRTIQGIARNRSNYSMQVVDRQGNLHLLQMGDVKEMALRTNSPMPGDYAKRLGKEQLRDLLAFLASQSTRE